MSGLKLRNEILGTEGLQDVPVLVFTAAGDQHLDSVGLKIHEVLRKPTGLPTLVARLDAILGRRTF
jgi:DNA-binding response OmpR family regulator